MVALLVTGGVAWAAAGSPGDAAELVAKRLLDRPTHSTDVQWGWQGSSSMLPLGSYDRSFSTGVSVVNQSTEDGPRHVTIEAFEVVTSEGITATARFLVGAPRDWGDLGSDLDLPPTMNVGKLTPFRPFDLPADPVTTPHDPPSFAEGHNWGIVVILEVEPPTIEFSTITGYRVQGTQGGEPFEDFVPHLLALCTDSAELSTECDAFAKDAGF